jgi:CMP-N,N'-diacetyllegionaminic acid synthase
MVKKNFLVIIPARSGSKRLKNKNILNFFNKPLIAHTINEALKVKELDEIIVSTDSKKILNISKKYGANVPFLRPKYLSKSKTPSYSVVLHAINYFKKKNVEFENVMLLQPTSPLRKAYHIRQACKLYRKKKAHSIISVCENDHPIEQIDYIDSSLSLKNFVNKKKFVSTSLKFKKSYKLNGAIYITNTKHFLRQKTFFLKKNIYAYIMKKKYSIDIDTKLDFDYAKFIKSKFLK